MAVLTALLAVIVVTAVHEAGHVAAVWIKRGQVRQVRVGRGPDLWKGVVRGATLVIALVPLGGRVHYRGIAPGTAQAVVAASGAVANLALAFVAFAAAAWVLGPEANPLRPHDTGPMVYAAAQAGAWFWAVPGAVVELVTTGSATELRSAVRALLHLLAEHPVTGLSYAIGALSALWAALNLIPVPVIETDGWHVARALWSR